MTNGLDTIWEMIEVGSSEECWEWRGYRNHGKRSQRGPGYGRLDILGCKGVYAHRAAYLAAHPGAITLNATDGKLILHRCDNPGCCNPAHMFVGTHKENMADMARKGRHSYGHSTKSPRAKLTADQVRPIRAANKARTRTIRQLAVDYSVSMATISGLLYGRHYQDVT